MRLDFCYHAARYISTSSVDSFLEAGQSAGDVVQVKEVAATQEQARPHVGVDPWAVAAVTRSTATSRQTPHTIDEETMDAGHTSSDDTRKVQVEEKERGSELDWVDDTMTIQTGDQRRQKKAPYTIDITVDSGAAEVVAPPTSAADYLTSPPPAPGSRNGTKYRAASGNMVANLRRGEGDDDDGRRGGTHHDVPGGGRH